MGNFEHKENRGSLFRNNKKENENQPDYRGDALINGKQVWLSAWLNEGKNGKYFSISFQDKDDTHKEGMNQVKDALKSEAPAGNFDSFDNDIPF